MKERDNNIDVMNKHMKRIKQKAKEYTEKVDDAVYEGLTEKEFNLSEKIVNPTRHNEEGVYIHTGHVKEFIRRLKEELSDEQGIFSVGVEETINKLAGEKLI